MKQDIEMVQCMLMTDEWLETLQGDYSPITREELPNKGKRKRNCWTRGRGIAEQVEYMSEVRDTRTCVPRMTLVPLAASQTDIE